MIESREGIDRVNDTEETPPAYRRVLLKLSGEALMGDLEYGTDPQRVQAIASEVAAAAAHMSDDNHRVDVLCAQITSSVDGCGNRIGKRERGDVRSDRDIRRIRRRETDDADACGTDRDDRIRQCP